MKFVFLCVGNFMMFVYSFLLLSNFAKFCFFEFCRMKSKFKHMFFVFALIRRRRTRYDRVAVCVKVVDFCVVMELSRQVPPPSEIENRSCRNRCLRGGISRLFSTVAWKPVGNRGLRSLRHCRRASLHIVREKLRAEKVGGTEKDNYRTDPSTGALQS